MSCPWAKIVKPEVSLKDIMSEEVARDMQDRENKKYEIIPNQNDFQEQPETETVEHVLLGDEIPEEILKAIAGNNFESDAAIAQMLQMQFDKEYDNELKRTADKLNGASKVSVSFDNYRRAPLNDDFESDSEEEEVQDVAERKHWDRFDPVLKQCANMPPCGYKRQPDGKVVTKHDVAMNGTKNAFKLLSFPPEFQTGDGESFDLKLSNKVFNSLRAHSKHEQVRRHRINDKKEDQATAVFGLDQFTRLILYNMINKQLLERVNGVVSIGKEAVILHADTDPSFAHSEEPLPKECVIKVFKTTLSEFKERDKYIKDDHRFKHRVGNQTTRKIIHMWAEKELSNLVRIKRAGVPCPTVITLKQHVLVMEFIGKNNIPAPKLKEAIMKFEDFLSAYEQVVELMKVMYEKANLIHADLSEYNILWFEKQCYIIDVSQSVMPSHENAFYFLQRDCVNVINFFTRGKYNLSKYDVSVATPDELFRSITGCDFEDKLGLQNIRESFKIKPHLIDRSDIVLNYNFDEAWEKSKNDKISGKVLDEVSPKFDSCPIEPPKA